LYGCYASATVNVEWMCIVVWVWLYGCCRENNGET